MNNISKNLLLALSLVCVIALIVFCIQLIVLNRGVEPIEPGSVVSGGSQPGNEPDNDEEPPDDEEGDGNEPEVVPVTPRPPPQGTRREIPVTENSRLVIYSSDDVFEFEERDFDWWFRYTGGSAALEISYTAIGPQGVVVDAETFLNPYTGGTDSVFHGDVSIHGSLIRGYHVTAQSGSDTYEAWIHLLIDSDLALVFVINYENDQQRDALYDVLSSMDIESLGGAGTGGTDPGND